MPKTYSENLANPLKKSVFYFQLHHLITSYYNLSLNFFFCKWIICYLSCLRGLRSCWCKNLDKKLNHYSTEALMWAYFMFIMRQVLLKIRVSSCLFYIFPNMPHKAIVTEMFNICLLIRNNFIFTKKKVFGQFQFYTLKFIKQVLTNIFIHSMF